MACSEGSLCSRQIRNQSAQASGLGGLKLANTFLFPNGPLQVRPMQWVTGRNSRTLLRINWTRRHNAH